MFTNIKLAWTRTLIIICALFAQVAAAADNEIQGAGSSLSNSIMQKLIREYGPAHRVDITYRAVGSGEGIRSIAAASIDFALTDVPLTKYELDLLGILQFPVFFSAITPIVNLPGVGSSELKLSGQVLAEIYMGRINNWRDAKLIALNPVLNLPDLPITVITRSDASGSSYVFTGFLSRESSQWAESLGIGSKLSWPTGQGVRGTDGVIKAVKQTPGAIGYAELGDAISNKSSIVQIKTGERFLTPSLESLNQSVGQFKWDRNTYYSIKGEGYSETQWPIVAVTYALIRRVCADDQDARDTLLFFDWILTGKNPAFTELSMSTPQGGVALNGIRRKFSEVVNSRGIVIQSFEPLRGAQ